MTYSEIALALDGPFAAIQVAKVLAAEVLAADGPRATVADCLHRYLRERTKAPPANGARREFEASAAFAAASALLGGDNTASWLELWRELRPLIMQGWLPESAEDPTLVAATSTRNWSVRLNEEGFDA